MYHRNSENLDQNFIAGSQYTGSFFFNFVDRLTALHFTAAGAPPTAKGTRILPMDENA
jgi:hypothetical protein